MIQPLLPLKTGILYECLNPECFYCGSMFTFEDVEWKHFWNSELEDLDFRPVCAACGDPMAHWEDDDNGKTQTFV